MYLVQTVQTSSAWRPPMPLPNEGKITAESLERRSTQIGQTTSVHLSPNTYTMGGNGGVFESQYAITPEKKEAPTGTPTTTKDNKKWSIGGLFRRKKKATGYGSTSEEEYAENGVVIKRNPKEAKKGGGKRSSKIGGFDHIVQVPTEQYGSHSGGVQRNTGSLDRPNHPIRANDGQQRNSSDDELLLGIRSCNSSNISRFRSDDSLMTNQSTPSNRRSRAARTERYMKRRSRDGEGSSPLIVGGPYNPNHAFEPQSHMVENRWKTQPIMLHGSQQSMTPSSTYSSNYQQHHHYQAQPQHLQQQPRLQNSTSLSQMPQIINFQMNYTTPPQNHQTNRMNPENRSFSYENYINQFSLPKSNHHHSYHHQQQPQQQQQAHYQPQYVNQAQAMTSPPPPPPRDPMRRLTVDTAQTVQSRPISYAFDKNNQVEAKGRNMGPRCVSDDHLWNQNGLLIQNSQLKQSPAYYSNMSMRSGVGHSPSQTRRRQTVSPAGLDPAKQAFKYVADATPRSRKPIHVFEDAQQQPQAANHYQAQRNKSRSATDFWKKIDQQVQHVPKEQSSDSLVHPMAIKAKAALNPQRSLDTEMKSNSLSRSYRFDVPVPQSCDQILNDVVVPGDATRFKPVNKYEEHIAKNMTVNNLRSPIMVAQQKKNPSRSAPSSHAKPDKSLWTAAESRDVVDCVKAKNLEDAINELEAIYKSLKLSDEELLGKADRRDIPSPTGFSKKVQEYQYDDDDDEDVDGNGMRKEPDLLLDDVAYRNLKHANNFPKVTDSQPPFGIPVGPIPPPAAQDYLKVTPISSNVSTSSMSPVGGDRTKTKHRDSPDLVSDDLAVRNLRKDNGQVFKPNQLMQPTVSNKKKPVRSQSANIYNLIQRDSTRPSGGNLDDYNVFDMLSKKLINLTDGDSDATDVPVTVSAMRKKENAVRPRDTRYKTISNFLHPNNTSGAVFNLPSTLQQKPPIPTPRKSLSPYLTDESSVNPESKGIDVLNKLVMDAKISSEKLNKDLQELRKDGKVAKEEEKSIVPSSEAPAGKRFVPTQLKTAEVGPPKPARTFRRTPTPSSPDTGSPQLKIFSPIIVDSGDSSVVVTPVVKEEVVLPVEKVNQLVDKFNERIKGESREASPVAVLKKSPVSAPKKSKSLTNKIKLLEDINDASKAVRACEQMLVDVVQDTPKDMLSDKDLLQDINEVSLAMKGCEQVLKGVIPIEGSDLEDKLTDKSTPERQSLVLDCELPVSVRVLKEAFEKENKTPSPVPLVVKSASNSKVAENLNMGDYDNLQEKPEAVSDHAWPKGEKIVLKGIECKPEIQKEIDEMMKACTEVMEQEEVQKSRETSKSCELLLPEKSKSVSVEKTPPFSTPVEEFSSPMKSSSVTPNNNYAKSSSLTSFHAFSSSDYLKSPSSDRALMSTFDQCVKSNSTTSYDVKSTTASLNSTEETLSPVEVAEVAVAAPSEKPIDQVLSVLAAVAEKQEKMPRGGMAEFVAADPTDSSQYNSSEELAMIFGIRRPSVTPPTGNQVISFSEWSELESAVDEDDEIDLDRNNNSLSAINHNSFTAAAAADPYQNTSANANSEADPSAVDSLSNPKCAAPPKLHGLRYFGTKRNELEIIFENPHENGILYEDPETENLLESQRSDTLRLDSIAHEGGVDEVDDLDLRFTAEMVIKKDMSVSFKSSSESSGTDDVDSGIDNGDKKMYSNELEINIDEGVVNGKESETATFRNDAAVGELDVVGEEQGVLPAKKNVDEKGAESETSSHERGSDLESSSSSSSSSSSGSNKSEAVANKLTCNDRRRRPESGERSTTSLPVMGEGTRRRRDHAANHSDVANGKERPNLLHPEHFLFASLAYQGLSSYDDILTMLAILIALITLIALIFI